MDGLVYKLADFIGIEGCDVIPGCVKIQEDKMLENPKST